MVAISSAVDVVNLALARIGYKKRIGSFYDGSLAARLALSIYAQTRDALIRGGEWAFAERAMDLTPLKSAPVSYVGVTWTSQYPVLPWLFEYVYPADCLKLRSVRAQPTFVPNFDPQHNIFSVENDNTLTPPQKVILCNVPSAFGTYAARVTDPTQWEADFIEEIAAELARKLAPALVGLDATKLEIADEQAAAALAATQRG